MITVIIPFYNEKDNLPILTKRLIEALSKTDDNYEVIFVDDGSTDGSKIEINGRKNIVIVSHKKRQGKGRSLNDAFSKSKGDVIIFMDADLQDDPADIKKFLSKIQSGYDFVNGWRMNRKDPISKLLPSAIFNFFLIRLLLRSKLHDVNSGFKAMRRSVLEEITLYGDNYRFLPIMADKKGFQTTEIPVNHNPRLYGKSKYGPWRLFFGFLDTISTYFIYRFAERPLHFFGIFGGFSFLTGLSMMIILLYERIFHGVLLYRRPAFIFSVLLIIVGIQIIMTGIIAELVVYLNQKKKKS